MFGIHAECVRGIEASIVMILVSGTLFAQSRKMGEEAPILEGETRDGLLVANVHEDTKLTASDASAFANFGSSVTIWGDTAVVGASRESHAAGTEAGSAYVFVRSDRSMWSEQAKLTASDAAGGDLFGISVAAHEDTVVVGALFDDHADGLNAGSAYVFVRDGSTWSEQAKLLASDATLSDEFGSAVALWGNTAVVGVPHDDDAGNSSGSALVFVRTGDTWFEQSKLTASDASSSDRFGNSVAVSGDTAVVGARDDDDAGTNSGSAYVYMRNGTTWSEQAKLTASDGAAFDAFGGAVAIWDDTAVVSALNDDDAGEGSGSAYVFVRTGNAWFEQAKLTARDATAFDQFGKSVSVWNETAVVGASGPNLGSAYVFVRTGNTWSELAKLVASDGAVNDRFGETIAVSSDITVVGAPGDNDDDLDSGSAYVFSDFCRITVTRSEGDALIWFTPESSTFDVVSGYLSELLADRDFSRATCLGTFLTSPAVDTLPGPSGGDARYFLARGLTSCVSADYGYSTVVPDPRDGLVSEPCP